jgi:pyruvate kinase
MSSFRPNSRILIFSDQQHILNTLNLLWGVQCFFYDRYASTDETIQDCTDILKNSGYVKTDDILINTASMPMHKRFRTNMLKVTVVE